MWSYIHLLYPIDLLCLVTENGDADAEERSDMMSDTTNDAESEWNMLKGKLSHLQVCFVMIPRAVVLLSIGFVMLSFVVVASMTSAIVALFERVNDAAFLILFGIHTEMLCMVYDVTFTVQAHPNCRNALVVSFMNHKSTEVELLLAQFKSSVNKVSHYSC